MKIRRTTGILSRKAIGLVAALKAPFAKFREQCRATNAVSVSIGWVPCCATGKPSWQGSVGKSSLLNVIQPGLSLPTGEVSDWTKKGKHTTRNAVLYELDFGGWILDTPGIRRMELCDVHPEEIEGDFVESHPLRPLLQVPELQSRPRFRLRRAICRRPRPDLDDALRKQSQAGARRR